MNQKNIFTGIAAILILQGLAFYFMGEQIMTGAFPEVSDAGHTALVQFMQVPAALSFMVGLIAYATRNTPNVAWAFTIGIGVLLIITLKHLLMDHIKVPIPAVSIQVVIFLACAYLWSQEKKV